jgi:hypothetical protein
MNKLDLPISRRHLLTTVTAAGAVGVLGSVNSGMAEDTLPLRHRRHRHFADPVPTSNGAAPPSTSTAAAPPSTSTGAAPPSTSTGAAPPSTSTGAARPSYNTGTGFFTRSGAGTVNSTSDSRIYDANGNTFRARGINVLHDVPLIGDGCISEGGKNTKANIVRIAMWFQNGIKPADWISWLQTNCQNNNLIATPAGFYTSATNSYKPNTATSGSADPNLLMAVVNDWINGYNGGNGGAAVWNQVCPFTMINIANEWGPSLNQGGPNTVWRDSYITAVQKLRAAGFNHTFLIDAPNSGEDVTVFQAAPFGTVIAHGPAIIEADPQHNIVFGCHVYVNIQAGQAQSFLTPIAQSGLPFIVSEFGPGRNIGPAPTALTPGELITACETLKCGWIAWAFDDNNLSSSESNDSWFALSYSNFPQSTTPPFGGYATSNPADLTIYGNNVVLATPNGQLTGAGATISGSNPGMCLVDLAVSCSIFPDGSAS